MSDQLPREVVMFIQGVLSKGAPHVKGEQMEANEFVTRQIRSAALEEAAQIADLFANEFQGEIAAGHVTHLTADAVLLFLQSIAKAIRDRKDKP